MDRIHRLALPCSSALAAIAPAGAVEAVSSAKPSHYTARFYPPEPTMLDLNPIISQINDLRGRVESLRGYL
jgi:hypothetical protein